MPSLAAAPDNPDTLPLVWAKAASNHWILQQRMQSQALLPRLSLRVGQPLASNVQAGDRAKYFARAGLAPGACSALVRRKELRRNLGSADETIFKKSYYVTSQVSAGLFDGY